MGRGLRSRAVGPPAGSRRQYSAPAAMRKWRRRLRIMPRGKRRRIRHGRAQKKARRAAFQSLVRTERHAGVRPSIAHGANGLLARRLSGQARHRDHQYVERHQSLSLAFPPARRGSEARCLAGGRLPGRDARDHVVRAVPETDDDALSQPARDGDGGAASLLSGGRLRADGRLRQDDAGAADGRHQHEPARDLHAGRPDAAWRLARQARSAAGPMSGNTGPSSAPARSPRKRGWRWSRASRARRAIA